MKTLRTVGQRVCGWFGHRYVPMSMPPQMTVTGLAGLEFGPNERCRRCGASKMSIRVIYR